MKNPGLRVLSRAALLPLLLPLLLQTACSSPDRFVYDTGQYWQKEQCQKLPDRDERMRCEKQASLSYDKYRAEAEVVKGTSSAAPAKAP